VLGALATGPGTPGAAGGPGRPAGVRVCESTSLGHAAQTAADAAGRGEPVVAVGGDGLVGTLAAALAGSGGTLGIIPAGRGNDFARMLGIPFRPAEAAKALLAGRPRAVDLIGVRAADGPEQIVAGSVYLGIPSEGGLLANRSRRLGGATRYRLAGLRALLGWQPATFAVDTGAGPGCAPGFPAFAVVVANSAYFAAGTMAAPAADVSDGLLDVVTVRHGRKLSFVRVMLAAGRGTHVRLDQVHTERATSVTVTADRAMPAGADGETLAHACPLVPGSPLRIRVLPGAVRVFSHVPAARPVQGKSPVARPGRGRVAAEERIDEGRA
jgi:diacylglycerol kinase (ATP)